VYQGLKKLTGLRKQLSPLAGGELEVIHTENEHVLGYVRPHADGQVIVFANFSENEQSIPLRVAEQYTLQKKKQLHGACKFSPHEGMNLPPLELAVFE